MSKPLLAAPVLATLALAAFAPGTLAPAAPAAPLHGLRLAQAQAFSEETLAAYARAAVEVERVRADYRERFEAAPEAERQAIAKEAVGAMLDAIDATPGISRSEYGQISQAALDDPALARKLGTMIESAGQ